ncbi:Molybdopterin or thiamine biosynthesis adenylyltransferase [[Luteovulum] sphaeroides subsp. megalophilum]|uniref:HesA/MoeB/ThiF family protein n=1 Tax=Cereibacter sphaeroides TaxID=1063 RepID=UPI000B722E7C|nr:HesA/MoeB/ThiF family protein [Cereibacter sphaeroides]SNT25686.1 Molybdopterin or thiamine biosynthesis adenylyltransferase [[Luteovulum] sphaeroides subsp. megalophilum]
MLALVLLAVVLWGLGWAFGVPGRLRLLMLACLWLALVLAHLLLPEAHPLRAATGGRAEPWLVLGGVAVLGLGYRLALGALRRRAAPVRPAAAPGAFRPAELERYARHILLREVGGPGQKRLKQARVLVVGAGGLGSPALLYLAASGVGTVGVIDADQVEASNLQRQVIHTDARIGWPKVHSAAEAMRALNPFIEVRPYERRLTEENAAALAADYDLILDGTDNFDTRYLVNRVAVAAGKPLIAGAIAQWEGQVSLYHPAAGGPCFQCTFPERPAPGLVPTCAEAGVIAPLPGVVGSIMAVEAVKHLTGAGATLRGALLIYDALWGETRRIGLKPRPGCPVCGGTGKAG